MVMILNLYVPMYPVLMTSRVSNVFEMTRIDMLKCNVKSNARLIRNIPKASAKAALNFFV